MNRQPTLEDVEAAQGRISCAVRYTPCEISASLSKNARAPVYLKLENTQVTGAFKVRGAFNAIAKLSPDEKRRGVITMSSGNHGRGLAYAAREAGIACTICLSDLVPDVKRRAIADLGAEVCVCGASQDEADVFARVRAEREGLVMISAFDHGDVIAGQGTIGLEILDQVRDLGTVVVPLSGGGLMAGIALAVRARKPAARIVGVSMDRGPAMARSLEAGRIIDVVEEKSLADALGGGIGQANVHTFELCRDLVDETILLSELEIADAMRHAYFEERQIVEGGGAVAIGAVLSGKLRLDGATVLIVSGRNVDMQLHHSLMAGDAPDWARD